MKNLPLEQKFSNLIERKINARNEKAQILPRPDGLIKYMDEEIDLLEQMEQYICDLTQKGATKIIIAAREGFKKGVSAGILEAKTGRAHPMHYFD